MLRLVVGLGGRSGGEIVFKENSMSFLCGSRRLKYLRFEALFLSQGGGCASCEADVAIMVVRLMAVADGGGG